MDAELPKRLTRALGVPPLVARLLIGRGLAEEAACDRFLHPRLTHLHDPARRPGADAAAQRLVQAVHAGRRVVIYGDYDVDGVTASAILWHVLTLAGARVETYIPHRLDEGYGLNAEAIAQLAGDDPDDRPLIISVDCGITAIEPARAARGLGVELIITDHHSFDPDHLPDADVLVHPGRTHADGSRYPFAELCGAGVAFKTAWQFARRLCGSDRLPAVFRDLFVDLLSLVALGTVADVVPLVDENRVLTVYGLGRIKQTRFVGLNALIDASRLRDERIDAYHVGFVLGPRLNACGRMGHAAEAVRLLTDAGEAEAAELARLLTRENERRRATERQIFDEARRLVVEHGFDREDHRVIVLGREGWHPGVVGIVASRLVEAFGRPTVLLCYENGTAKGSARSVEGVSIFDAFTACAEHLKRYGGHAMAGGLTLATDAVEPFRAAMVEYVNARLEPHELRPLLRVEATVGLDAMRVDVLEWFERLAPFGRGNPSPRLLLRDVTLDRPGQRIGREGKHLALWCRQNGRVMRAVGFGLGEQAEALAAGDRLDLVVEPRLSTWQGQRRPDLHVQDLRPLAVCV